MKKAHDIGPGMTRISLTLPVTVKRELQALADNSSLSLNAYIGAILEEATETKPVVLLRPQIIRESRPEYAKKKS